MEKLYTIKEKNLGILILLNTIFVSLWAIALISEMVLGNNSYNTPESALNYVKSPSLMFYFIYSNALILTIINMLIFIGFFVFFNEKNLFLRIVAISFLIMYALLNIFSYGSQIILLPYLVNNLSEFGSQTDLLVLMFIQIYPNSVISIINLSAYGIFGIPSAIFGYFLFQEDNKNMKIGGSVLILSAIFVILSVIALIALISDLPGLFSIFGGFLNLVSYFFLINGFLKQNSS